MKKIFMTFAACIATLSLSAQDLVIPKFDGAPVIDGVVDPVWDLVDQVDCEFEPTDDYGDASLFESWFKMGWNDTAFFLLVRRDENDFANQWETSLADWQSDRDEIFFDVNVDTLVDGRGSSDSQTGASYGHYQFTSIWTQDAETWTGWPNQWYHNAPYKLGYNFDSEDSYYCEYAFPFSSLAINTELLPSADPTFQGAVGVIFGFQMVFSDVDMDDSPTDESFRKFKKLVDEDGWDLLDDARHVELGGDIIAVPSALDVTNSFPSVTIFPNPAADYFSLNNLYQTANIKLYDCTGNLIITSDNVDKNTQINISLLSRGLYFVKLNNETSLKFIKQ